MVNEDDGVEIEPDKMPERYTDECDMEIGPCACGAWHGSGPFKPLDKLFTCPPIHVED